MAYSFFCSFFIPQSLLFAELCMAFPEEGGPYLRARLAFGRLIASVNSVLYWVTNLVWLGGNLSVLAVAMLQTFFMNGKSLNTFRFYAFTLVFIWAESSLRFFHSKLVNGFQYLGLIHASLFSVSFPSR